MIKKNKTSSSFLSFITILMTLIIVSCSNWSNHENERIITKIRISKDLTDTISVIKEKFSNTEKIISYEIILYKENQPSHSELTTSEYNFKGNLIKQLVVDSYDSIGIVVDYIYENDTLKRKIYNSKKENEFSTFFKYKNGKLIEIENSDSLYNSYLLSKETFKYTDNNSISEKQDLYVSINKSSNDTLSFEKTIYKFDKNELLKEMLKLNSANSIIKKENYLYENNLLKTKILFDHKGIIKDSIHYKYEFNDNKIWIKRNTYIDNVLVETTIRDYK